MNSPANSSDEDGTDGMARTEAAVVSTVRSESEEIRHASERQTAQPDEEKEKDAGRINGWSRGKIAMTMIGLSLAVFLSALDTLITTTANPTIIQHFKSPRQYSWIGSAYTLASGAASPIWGKVSDIFGRKHILLLAIVIFMIGALVVALATSIGMLLAGRAIQGAGAGGLVVIVNVIIGDLFPLRIRGVFYGIIGGIWALAAAIGPILGGVFAEDATWRWCFYINLPIAGLAFVLLLFFLDLQHSPSSMLEGLRAVDWVGSATIVGGSIMLLFGLLYGGVTAPWDSAEVICLIIFGVITLGIFLFWEYQYAVYPVTPLSLFSGYSRVAILVCVASHGLLLNIGAFYLPFYFQAVRGASPILSGVYTLAISVGFAFAALATGPFVAKSGNFQIPLYVGMTCLTLGHGLFIDFDATSNWAKIILFQIVAGLGIGIPFQALIVAFQAHTLPRDISTATTALLFIRQLAVAVSVVIGQVVIQNRMNAKAASLEAMLGPDLAKDFLGPDVGANIRLIGSLPPAQRALVRNTLASSLSTMWIVFTCISAVGLMSTAFIRKTSLTREHQETKTGLEQEKINATLRAEEKRTKGHSESQGNV